MYFIKHAPVFSILIVVLLGAFINYLSNGVGKNADAAGAGMASGLFDLFYGGLLVLYIIILLVSFIWYRGNSTELTTFKIIYHCILYVPLLFIANNFLDQFIKKRYENKRHENSYKEWHTMASTKLFKNEELGFEFEYSDYSKGTFNTSYFEQVKVIEESDRMLLVGENDKIRSLRAQVRKVTTSLAEFAKQFEAECSFENAKDSPLGLSNEFEVLEMQSDICVDNYIYEMDFKKYEFSNSPSIRKPYYIVPKGSEDVFWEVLIDQSFILIGPTEKNQSRDEVYQWYHTLKFAF